ncbi:MAG TPA: TCR/Tet family MFS transporter [Candidatus Polarisedimenticolia bacterium]|nr:TCR/Tet family MFS transporter [Candidatus Polarisedimenticolia bacterium]
MMRRAPGKHALVFVAITVLLDIISFGLILPVLPALLVELTGESMGQAAIRGGWLSFVYAVMQFLCAPVLGNISDRFGRRVVLLFAVAALGLDFLVMGFAPTFGWLFLGRLISGIAGASFTPAYAYVADISPPDRRAQSFGLLSAAFGVGFILGPALGGLLGGFGSRMPFFVAAGLSLTNFVYGLFVLPESLPPEKRRAFDLKRANPLGTLLQMRQHPMLLSMFGALFLWMLGHQVMPTTWAFYTKLRFGWSAATIGASLALAGAVMALSQATLMRLLVPRLGERRVALTGIAVAGVGYVGYTFATQGWMMFAWLPTWLFGALVMPTTNAFMSHRVPADAQGELQGAVASLFSLSSIIGPPMMTQVFGRFSSPSASPYLPGAAFLVAAMLTAVCFVIYGSASRERAPGTRAVAAAP